MGPIDDAINSYKQAIKLHPEFSDAFLNLGIIFEETDKLDEALKNLERANEIDPDNPLILNNLGIALEKLDRKEDAIIHFEKAIEIDPFIPDTSTTLQIFFSPSKLKGLVDLSHFLSCSAILSEFIVLLFSNKKENFNTKIIEKTLYF